ncbi:thioredoxin [Candidatus Saccharibacteria bacterium]|nr:thioredoxin [Candidatus Saccharibacteria bacterium]
MSNIQNLTQETFNDTIKDGLILVDFNADWCGPCQMQAPILEEIASESNTYKIAAVNVDDQSDLAAAHSVSSIPCMILFKDGKEVERIVGLRPKRALLKTLEKHQG